MSVGVDTGGTFTDLVRLDRGRLTVHKVRSTPEDPSRAIAEGLLELTGELTTQQVVHGSTVATNAVLERTGARVALVATAGFEDVVRIARQTRPALYDFFVRAPRPLVDPALTFGVVERLDVTGEPIVPLDPAELDTLATRLLDAHVEMVAVCLLHSYVNPVHEQQAAACFRSRGLAVCTSHEVLPEYREFERWSTTLVNAYVAPLMDGYLGRLESFLPRLSIMQSNGGSISAAAARHQPVRTILSGPAAGVVGARAIARAAGARRVIAFDMGGTSTDVSLIDDRIATTTDSTVGEFPVRLPILDIETVGAGGGSIAGRDPGGALRVGPRSAGAEPGPVCLGRGEELTVTDANLLLGRLAPEWFFGGRLAIDLARTERVAARLAAELSVSVEGLAEAVVRVANANMERAIRLVSIERGHDPRRFALLAFGGAGGMHACEIAAQLGIRKVIVPRHAGVLSALGMLLADVGKDYSASVLRREDEMDARALAARFAPLQAEARRALESEGFPPARQRIVRALDLRYAGQSYELTVRASAGFRADFDRLHRRRYGYSDPRRTVEIVNARVFATGRRPKVQLPFRRTDHAGRPKPASVRPGRFDGRACRVSHYRWDDLAPGARAAGPAVITSGEATAVIPPKFRFRVDGYGNVIAEPR